MSLGNEPPLHTFVFVLNAQGSSRDKLMMCGVCVWRGHDETVWRNFSKNKKSLGGDLSSCKYNIFRKCMYINTTRWRAFAQVKVWLSGALWLVPGLVSPPVPASREMLGFPGEKNWVNIIRGGEPHVITLKDVYSHGFTSLQNVSFSESWK